MLNGIPIDGPFKISIKRAFSADRIVINEFNIENICENKTFDLLLSVGCAYNKK